MKNMLIQKVIDNYLLLVVFSSIRARLAKEACASEFQRAIIKSASFIDRKAISGHFDLRTST